MRFMVGVLAILLGGSTVSAELIISEVVDATLPGGLPKYVELTNCGDSDVDLSEYSIGNYNNGGTTLGGGASTVLSGILAPGESYVISYEFDDGPGMGVFFDTYGFDPDNFDLGAFVNGDDVIALFLGPATGDGSDATLVDVYGVIGEDGTGTVWEYTDSYASRNPGAAASSVFVPGEWNIAGADALEDGCGGDDVCEEANILANTDPGVHSCVGQPPAIPTVSEWGMIVMTLLLLTAGTVAFGRRQTVLAGVAGVQFNAERSLFNAVLFTRILLAVVALSAAVLVGATLMFGPLPARDIIGTSICAVLLSYLLHLWVAFADDRQ